MNKSPSTGTPHFGPWMLLMVLCAIAYSAWAASCPTAKYDGYQWPKGTTVYYDTSTLDQSVQAPAVQTAISDWNTANESDGSDVTFEPADSDNPATLVFSDTPEPPPGASGTCTPSSGDAAETCPGLSGQSVEETAVVVFNLKGTFSVSGASYPIYDSTSSNYSTFMTKVALHEIGHTMGLGDQNTTSCGATNNTVMNGYCDTNDSGNNMASDLSSGCDANNVKSNSTYGGSNSPGSGAGPTPLPGAGNSECSGVAPNESCLCDSGDWDCYCQGTPITCDDGTLAVCYEGDWSCGTVSTSEETDCTGTAPTCGDGSDAVCVSGVWLCDTCD